MAFPIHPDWDLVSTRGRIDRRGSPLALSRLREACAQPQGRSALRRLAWELNLLAEVGRRTDDEICIAIAAAVERGVVAFVDRTPIVQAPPPMATTENEAATPSPSEGASDPVKTWIEIELIGEDDQPIPSERYRIELPDGSVREGSLNARGFARVDGLDPGTCKVTFPNLDRDAWKTA